MEFCDLLFVIEVSRFLSLESARCLAELNARNWQRASSEQQDNRLEFELLLDTIQVGTMPVYWEYSLKDMNSERLYSYSEFEALDERYKEVVKVVIRESTVIGDWRADPTRFHSVGEVKKFLKEISPYLSTRLIVHIFAYHREGRFLQLNRAYLRLFEDRKSCIYILGLEYGNEANEQFLQQCVDNDMLKAVILKGQWRIGPVTANLTRFMSSRKAFSLKANESSVKIGQRCLNDVFDRFAKDPEALTYIGAQVDISETELKNFRQGQQVQCGAGSWGPCTIQWEVAKNRFMLGQIARADQAFTVQTAFREGNYAPLCPWFRYNYVRDEFCSLPNGRRCLCLDAVKR